MTLQASLLRRLQQTLPQANLLPQSLPLTPSIALWLIDPAIMDCRLSDDEVTAVFADPAYWTFCWASGQALAAQILAAPALVAGKTVIDVGCGSGVVAIAAALAGAARVIACDIDPVALQAAEANAELNGVTLEYLDDLFTLTGPVDLLLAADVLYDRENRPLVNAFRQMAGQVIIADSRVRDFAEPGYCHARAVRAVTFPDLGEFEEFKTVNFYETC